MLNHRHIGERIKVGKCIEQRIIDALVEEGFKIAPATVYQDKRLKIDGYLGEERLPVQIKYRLPQNKKTDIVFEAVWLHDFSGNRRAISSDADFDGRDFVGASEVYIVLENDGRTVHFCRSSDVKHHAYHMAMNLIESGARQFSNEFGQVRIVRDEGESARLGVLYEKIIFYGL